MNDIRDMILIFAISFSFMTGIIISDNQHKELVSRVSELENQQHVISKKLHDLYQDDAFIFKKSPSYLYEGQVSILNKNFPETGMDFCKKKMRYGPI